MGNVQPNYNATLDVGYEGQVPDTRLSDIVSRLCEPASIGFGKAVIRGTNARQVKLGAAGVFEGITVRDIALPVSNGDVYLQYDNVGVLRKGTLFVVAADAVTRGDVVYRTPTGTLTNLPGTRTATPGANVGTGTGSIGAVTVTDGAKVPAGNYTVRIVKAASNAGDFVVERAADLANGVTQAIVGYGTVAVAFAQGGLSFTLADATDFVVGDTIPIVVSGGNTRISDAVWEDTIAQNAVGRLRIN